MENDPRPMQPAAAQPALPPSSQLPPASTQPMGDTASGIPDIDLGDDFPTDPEKMTPEQRRAVIILIIILVVVILATIITIAWLWNQPAAELERIRDFFLILMGLMSMVTSITLVILLLQLARLINLLQNELRPMMDSTNETLAHLRGTTVFLSDNIAEPLIKLNEYMAGFSQLVQILGLGRKPPRPKPPKGV